MERRKEMKCEGCGARLDFAEIPLFLIYGKAFIRCPICKLNLKLWIKGSKIETEVGHLNKLKSWKKRAKP